MARRVVIAAWALGMLAPGVRGEGVVLRPGASGPSRVLIEMRAEGEYRPENPAGSPKTVAAPKPQPLKIESRLDFVERTAASEPSGAPSRSARRVVEAVTAVGDRLLKIRPEVASLVGERREAGVTVYSTGGPLTRWELEMVQVPGDPLALGGLLPEKPVGVGDRWPVSAFTTKNLTDYDTLASNGLEVKLESLDDARAICRVGGTVKGSARGGEGEIAFKGEFTFDRKAGRISKMDLMRDETRKQGLVEWGLAVKSRITFERTDAPTPPELSDDAIAALPKAAEPARERLVQEGPERKFTLEHDRDWHLTLETNRQLVLKRLDGGQMIAQCNLAVGPSAGAGRHQDPAAFREDVKKALGARFGAFAGEGELPGPTEADYRYKVGVAGREGALDILWYYILIASPAGDQLLATFTLDASAEAKFGNQDEQLIGALEWKAARK